MRCFQLQHTASGCGVERFYLVTDMRVFGGGQAGREDETPLPETPTGILINAAEEVLRCVDPKVMQTLLIRVTHLYSSGLGDAFFTRARQLGEAGQALLFDGTKESTFDFLHIDDLGLFITLALEKKLSGVAHLAYGERFSYGETEQLLRQYLPELNVTYSDNMAPRTILQCSIARDKTGWIPRHRWVSELDEILVSNAEKNSKTPAAGTLYCVCPPAVWQRAAMGRADPFCAYCRAAASQFRQQTQPSAFWITGFCM